MKQTELLIIGATVSNKFIEISNPCTIPIEMMESMIEQAKKLKDNHTALAMYIQLPFNVKQLKGGKKKNANRNKQ